MLAHCTSIRLPWFSGPVAVQKIADGYAKPFIINVE